ncbi:MAG: UDP-3-O-(3-hydroxymyristoyl)glucosamine N-acyltransferase [Gemmataceae bacterium]|nr:UDP-3-O-(3-hydroxymyristoyl)glucosamine N-acyltransferase [Gemmataceae bacterium]MCS7271318.1 UDP-3-O-(3-hydroxymyristoyl)glucosamine N-acyltransferase [Gemmataceae bacterium]MDW8244526.1 UDP-3-O-(3-hydroxymyristoyl)glucosamine N-acyltransferase [Thermogemmata sp.]
MAATLQQVAEWVNGEVQGDGSISIYGARSLHEAGPGDITFLESDKHWGAWERSRASAAIVPRTLTGNGRPIIRVSDPLTAFIEVVQRLRATPAGAYQPMIHPTACIDPTAVLGPEVSVGPYVVIGAGTIVGARCTLHAGVVIGRNCRLGDDVVLYPHVVLYDQTVIGQRVIIHAHAVIGADGFGYRTQQGKHMKVPQLGWVEIEDDVEIGAGSTIDRGTFEATRVGQGTKIDNLVMIGHNCRIGRHNLLCSQVGIAGSCTTGDYVVMAGQVGVADHLTIGDHVIIGAKSGVPRDVPPHSQVLGMPALPRQETARIVASMEKLPELRKDVARIKKVLGLED